MKKILTSALAALAALACTTAVTAAVATKPGPPAHAAKPPKADKDRNKVFDDLEQKLAGKGPDGGADVIVRIREKATAERVDALLAKVGGGEARKRFASVNAFAVRLPKKTIEALAREPDLVQIEDDSTVYATNDSAQASFGVAEARLDAPSLDGDGDGSASTYSKSDLVAVVIDTGIDANHRDLDGGKVLAFADFVNGRTDAYDDNGHGTHVAGTIAGDVYAGVAPGAALIGLKVLAADGSGSTSGIIAALDWVLANKDAYGIDVVNMSLGADGCADGTDSLSAAVDRIAAAGIVAVVAAGNAGPGACTIGSPAAARDAITVGAMADTGAGGFSQADFSSRGPTLDGRVKPDISAPGVQITSAQANTPSGYVVFDGTSMATPFVAGVALLMRDAQPTLTPVQIRDALERTAIDWGRAGRDSEYGAGRLDAYAALASIGAPLTSPPPAPAHSAYASSLASTGVYVDYKLAVTDTRFPIAATLIHGFTASGAYTPDFDLYLYSPSGAIVARAETTWRQESITYTVTTTGTYTLRVRSYAGGGPYQLDVSLNVAAPVATPPPPVDTTAPAAPTGLALTAADARIALDWADNTESDLVGYRVFRRNADGTWPTAPLATTTSSAYADAAVVNGTTYTYRVSAFDTASPANESAPSAAVSGAPVRAALTKTYVPTSMSVVNGSVVSGTKTLSYLYSNDAKRVEVDGTIATLAANATMTSSERSTLRSLTIVHDSSASLAGAGVTVQIYNARTGQWVTLDGPRTGVTTDLLLTISVPTPKDYVSSTGAIKLRTKATASSKTRLRVDAISFAIEY